MKLRIMNKDGNFSQFKGKVNNFFTNKKKLEELKSFHIRNSLGEEIFEKRCIP